MTRSLPRICLCLILALWAIGCSGGDVSPTHGGPLPAPPVNEFTLKSDVVVLPADVTVVAVTDTQVVLSGPVPPLVVGQVIIQNAGDLTFVRRIVSIDVQNGQTVITTAEANLGDVFQQANIQQTEILAPEVLAQMEPNLPGVTLTAPATARLDAEQLSRPLMVKFENTPLTNRGDVIAYLNGDLQVVAGFERALLIGTGADRVAINPFAHVRGTVRVNLVSNEMESSKLYLTGPITIPLQKLGEVPITGTLQLSLDLTGQMEEATIVLECEGEGNEGRVNVDWNVSTGEQLRSSASFERDWTAPIPLVRAGSMLRVSGSLCTLESSIDFAGPGNVRGNNWSIPLMGFECNGSFGSEGGVEGTRVVLSERRFDPFGFDIFSPGRGTYAPLSLAGSDPRELASGFNPILNSNSLTNLHINPSQTIDLRVGQSLLVTARGNLGITASGGNNLPVIMDWSLVPGANPDVVDFAPGRGPTVRLTGTSPGVVLIQGDYTDSQGVRHEQALIFTVRVGGPTQTNLVIEGRSDGEFLPEEGETWFLTRREQNLDARVFFTNGNSARVTQEARWTSNNPSVAEVVAPGLIRPLRPGTVEITAVAAGLTAKKTITILPPDVVGVRMTPPPPMLLRPGQIHQFALLASMTDGSVQDRTGTAQWTSSDPSVAEVDANGVVTGRSAGRAFVLAVLGSSFAVAEFNVGVPPVTGLQIEPSAITVQEGGTTLVRVQATFADGTFADVTDQTGRGTIFNAGFTLPDDAGRVTGLFPGEFPLTVTFRGATARALVTVTGPVLLRITQAPPPGLAPGQPFDLAAQLQDELGNPQPQAPTRPVQVAILSGPGEFGGGGATRTTDTVSGLASFPGLTLNTPGDYQLRVTAPGLNGAETGIISVNLPNTLGRLIVANTEPTASSLAVVDVLASGDLSAVTSSPFGVSAARTFASTNSTPQWVERLGNFVYLTYQNQTLLRSEIEIFSFDPTSGQLASQAVHNLMASNFFSSFVEGNGSNSLLAVSNPATGEILSGLLANPGTGALTQVDLAINSLFPGGRWGTGALTVLSGAASDLVLVAGASETFGPVTARHAVQVFGWNHSVSPPTLNFLSSVDITGLVQTGLDIDVLNDVLMVAGRLYVAVDTGTGSGRIVRFDLNTGTGVLSNQATAFQFPVDPNDTFPQVLYGLNHPVAGQLLYVAERPVGFLRTLRVEANGDLTPLFRLALSGNTSGMQDFTDPNTGNRFLMLSLPGSDSVQTFQLDATTGEPTPVNTEAGFLNPSSLAK